MSGSFERLGSLSQQITERQAILKRLLQSSREIRGLPVMEVSELSHAALSWERALRDIPTNDLQESYDFATRNYRDPEKPFGTAQMLLGYQCLVDERRSQRAKSIKPSTGGPCQYCGDSGYQTIQTSSPAGTCVRPCACTAAPPGERSDYPLREPQYQREPGGRWWSRVQEERELFE